MDQRTLDTLIQHAKDNFKTKYLVIPPTLTLTEIEYIVILVHWFNNNLNCEKACRDAGLSRASFYRKIRELGITRGQGKVYLDEANNTPKREVYL